MEAKADDSPVTRADKAADEIIADEFRAAFEVYSALRVSFCP